MPTPRSVWILGDQLLWPHPALADCDPAHTQVLLVESHARAARMPYHRHKLVLLFSAMRHYAQRLRDAGWTVDYRITDGPIRDALHAHVEAVGSARLVTMAASSTGGRRLQAGLGAALGIPVDLLPDSAFLTSQHSPYGDAPPGQRVVMEYFYRGMRRHFGVLMDADGEPVGGQWNFDKDNRKPLPKHHRPPTPLRFPPDALTQQVMGEVAALPGIGAVDGFALAVTHADAEAAAAHFFRERLALFGDYEDAMSSQHATLYHSVLSPYLNICLLRPMPLIRAAEAAYHAGEAPINSVEGFVRQILGWREFMHWQYWRVMPGILSANAWDAQRPLPRFFWDPAATDMACLHTTLARIQATGYAHHIERLMLLSNFATLAGLDPLAVNDWFLGHFIDAYEWVMVPNVLGMGLNADGGGIATKPYIASANYVHKMGDHCAGCRFDRKARTGPDACPFNLLYWHFLLTHEQRLRANPRSGKAVLGLRHLDEAERARVREEAAALLESL